MARVGALGAAVSKQSGAAFAFGGGDIPRRVYSTGRKAVPLCPAVKGFAFASPIGESPPSFRFIRSFMLMNK